MEETVKTEQKEEDCERCLDAQMIKEYADLNEQFYQMGNGIFTRAGSRVTRATLDLIKVSLEAMALAGQGLQRDLGFEVSPFDDDIPNVDIVIVNFPDESLGIGDEFNFLSEKKSPPIF